MRNVLLGTVAALATAALVASGTTAATASETDTDTDSEAIASLVEEATQPVEITVEAAGSAVTTTAGGGAESSVSFELPGEAAAGAVGLESVPTDLQSGDGQPISSTELDGALLTSYESGFGVQTLIEITGGSAPSEYSFPFELAEGASLELQPDGSVFVNDTTGLPSAMIDVPWAFDADGSPVPTSFRVEGSTVVQIVDTSAVTAFPVIADPDFWWIVGSSAVCVAEIAGLAMASAKVVQAFAKADKLIRAAKTLGKYYDALGGRVDKVIGVFRKWVSSKGSLTRTQLNALEGMVREGGKFIFNVVGLGTCYSLVTQR